MLDVILDTLLDFLKTLPFLFLTYLLLEFLEHKMGARTRAVLRGAGPFAPAVGGLLGAVPQCGFSAAAAGLYAGRVLTLGTLFAVFLSTSDEMLIIVLSNVTEGTFAPWSVLRILGGKVVIGILCGTLIDAGVRLCGRFRRGEEPHTHEEEMHAHIGKLCAHDHCGCEGGIFRSALRHTLEIGGFLLLVTFALNTVVHFVGQDVLADFLRGRGALSCLLSALVGLIPNCAASVVVTELYLAGALSVGALYAGLLTGAGVGILVLCRANRPWWHNLLIIVSLWGIGALFGSLIDLCGFEWLGLKFR